MKVAATDDAVAVSLVFPQLGPAQREGVSH